MIETLLDFMTNDTVNRVVFFGPPSALVAYGLIGWWLSRRRFNGFIQGVQPKLSPIDEAGMAILRSVRETPERWEFADSWASPIGEWCSLHVDLDRFGFQTHEPRDLKKMQRPLRRQIIQELRSLRVNQEAQRIRRAADNIIKKLEPPK